MRKIEVEELKQILDLHAKWIWGQADGKCAVLTGTVITGADLTRADFTGADLTRADLTRADFTDAVLTDVDFTGAVLTDADFTRADLTRADLTRAVLTDADFTRAVLARAVITGADLTRADFTGAVLTDTDFTGADLTDAVLTPIRDDLWAVLSASPAEVPGLLAALWEGRVNGSAYNGDCACLVGTLANVRRCRYDAIPGLQPSVSRAAERFFLAIKTGDTPETNQFSARAAEWIEEWLSKMRAAFGPQRPA